MDGITYENGFQASLDERVEPADTYIRMTPVPNGDKGHLVLEDTSRENFEVIRYDSKDAGGVYIGPEGARNLDGTSTGVHPRGARVRGNFTAQDAEYLLSKVTTAVNEVQYIKTNYQEPELENIVNPKTITTATTITPDSDIVSITALAANATIAAPSVTLFDGRSIVLRIKDNGTARTLTWNAIYRNIGVTRPSSTTANKTMYIAMRYNADASKWDILSISREA